MIIIRKAEELKLIQVHINEIVLIDTKSPKVRIEVLMTGTKIKACHQIMADSDDLTVSSKLVLN